MLTATGTAPRTAGATTAGLVACLKRAIPPGARARVPRAEASSASGPTCDDEPPASRCGAPEARGRSALGRTRRRSRDECHPPRARAVRSPSRRGRTGQDRSREAWCRRVSRCSEVRQSKQQSYRATLRRASGATGYTLRNTGAAGWACLASVSHRLPDVCGDDDGRVGLYRQQWAAEAIPVSGTALAAARRRPDHCRTASLGTRGDVGLGRLVSRGEGTLDARRLRGQRV